MKGRLNFIVGGVGLILSVAAALALGITFDEHGQREGLYLFSVARFYLRFAHTHGMPLSLYNLIVGLCLAALPMTPRRAKLTAWGAASTWLIPSLMTLKGALGAPEGFPHLEIVGIVGLVVSAALLVGAAARGSAAKTTEPGSSRVGETAAR